MVGWLALSSFGPQAIGTSHDIVKGERLVQAATIGLAQTDLSSWPTSNDAAKWALSAKVRVEVWVFAGPKTSEWALRVRVDTFPHAMPQNRSSRSRH